MRTQRIVYQTSSHFCYDLGPCQCNERIQEIEPELSLIVVGCHLGGVPIGWLEGVVRKQKAVSYSGMMREPY
jgi:hypothetical protein